MTQTEETTCIIIKDWQITLNEKYDMFEYEVTVRRETTEGYYENEVIRGGNILNTLKHIISDLAKNYKLDKEWIWKA